MLDYNKTLKQRSVVLNRLKEKYSKQTEAELDAWSEKLVESGVEIILHRKSFRKIQRVYKNIIQ